MFVGTNKRIRIGVVVLHAVLSGKEERNLRALALVLTRARRQLRDLTVLLLQVLLALLLLHASAHHAHTTD